MRFVDIVFMAGYYKALYYYNQSKFTLDPFYGSYAYWSTMIFLAFVSSILLIGFSCVSIFYFDFNLILALTTLGDNKYEWAIFFTLFISVPFWFLYMHKKRYVKLLNANKDKLSDANKQANKYFILALIVFMIVGTCYSNLFK